MTEEVAEEKVTGVENKEEEEEEENVVAENDGDDDGMALSRQRVEEAKADRSGRVYRVYCDGVFDLFHVGHALMFKQAKLALGAPEKTHLIAGVCSDELTRRFKGETVMDHKTRCESVANCRWVDEVAPDAPWVLDAEFLEKYHIDFVAHDAIPYKGEDTDDVYSFVKKRGMFLETQRTEGISSSDIIMQIVRDYDVYVDRNIDRGYTTQQLNLSLTNTMRANARLNQRMVASAYKAFMKSKTWGNAMRLMRSVTTLLNPISVLPRNAATFTVLTLVITLIALAFRRIRAQRRM